MLRFVAAIFFLATTALGSSLADLQTEAQRLAGQMKIASAQYQASQHDLESLTANVHGMDTQLAALKFAPNGITAEQMLLLNTMMSTMQQTFAMVSTLISSLNKMVMETIRPIKGNSALHEEAGDLVELKTLAAHSVGQTKAAAAQFQASQGDVEALNAEMHSVQTQIDALRTPPSNLAVSEMFQLQYQMQIMSQYLEACSSMLSAVHQSMMSMAKAAKGN